jgi:hypothetical protein
MSQLKVYLGDGCYADYDGWYIVLTTENGIETTNTIALEPSVLAALNNYAATLPERAQRLAVQPKEVSETDNPQFWAYLHSNGKIIVKRWYGDVKDYTTDCEGNDFVQRVVPPFKAASVNDAVAIATERLA